MLDIQFIRENTKLVEEKSKQKGAKVDLKKLLALDEKRRRLLTEQEEVKSKRNKIATDAKGAKPTAEQIKKGKALKNRDAKLNDQLDKVAAEYADLLKSVPNIPLKDVPIGKSEAENVVVRKVGEKPKFDFKPKNHWELAEARAWIDKERAAKVAGARFAYLKGDIVHLQWALMQFALDHVTDEIFLKQLIDKLKLSISNKPFTPVLPPLLIKTDVYDKMDRLEPCDDRYKIEGEELWLQGSAEHVLGSMHTGETFDEQDLPIRYAGFATSFRKEAGTYGKDMEGIIRMHQFDKLEMESLTTPETALNEHLLMIAIQETLMQKLGLPYQVLNKCTADIGKPNARGWDIEVWLPGQAKYRETHTADYMTDYQARRLGTKYRTKEGSTKLVHTNDATVFAQRAIIGILENYQTKDGNVLVPEVLIPYMQNRSELR